MTDRDAFLFGFRTGRRLKRFLSPREALAILPTKSGFNVDVFLNGADDGARNDRWRLDLLAAQEIRAAAA